MFRSLNTRIGSRQGIERIFRERLSEPIHLNFISLFVALFGGTRAKIYFDLIARHQFAFGVLHAADQAKFLGIPRVKALEFGTATGVGLRNLSEIGRRVSKATGVEVEVIGFDGAVGLPEPRDYRDHPDLYTVGTFKMQDPDELIATLPSNARLIRGEVAETVPAFVSECTAEAPVGFMSIDLDYYFSSVDALKVLDGPPDHYLPATTIYLDDVWHERHNDWCGELLAVHEFNEDHELRKIAPFTDLRGARLFKNPRWIDKIYTAHIIDHPTRTTDDVRLGARGAD
jgi:hypothetical protein